jgi:hypothetical protein
MNGIIRHVKYLSEGEDEEAVGYKHLYKHIIPKEEREKLQEEEKSKKKSKGEKKKTDIDDLDDLDD